MSTLKPDVFFIDQLSHCIPLLRILFPRTKIFFYCHHPDKLLASRQSSIRRIYRSLFDRLEEYTTGLSDSIAVNSHYTASVFKTAFTTLSARTPTIIYPCVKPDETPAIPSRTPLYPYLTTPRTILLSINRFERKKNIELALSAFAHLPPPLRARTLLVLAGGHDPRLPENVTYLSSLQAAATAAFLPHTTMTNYKTHGAPASDVQVLFLPSVPAGPKNELLRRAAALLYTPAHEHLGIVPLEAMAVGTPVLAVASGGPLETVVDGQTGWLREADARVWTGVLDALLSEAGSKRGKKRAVDMGRACRGRVKELFSAGIMRERLDREVRRLVASREPRPSLMPGAPAVVCAIVGVCVSLMVLGLAVWLNGRTGGGGGASGEHQV